MLKRLLEAGEGSPGDEHDDDEHNEHVEHDENEDEDEDLSSDKSFLYFEQKTKWKEIC